MTDEYMEQKIRVYQPKKKTDEAAVSKYMVRPMMKVMGLDSKPNPKKSRLTA